VAVYELLAEHREELPETKLKVLDLYMEGITKYRAMKFSEALVDFEKALVLDPKDGPSKVYQTRSKLYVEEPPGADWDGVWTLHEK
jgi:hypothetical protein